MKVILKADIKGVGKKDEVINASDGYARNYLFPKKLAVPADVGNMNNLKAKNDSKAFRKEEQLKDAKATAEKLKSITLKFVLKAGENGKVFGGITAKEISEKLKYEYNIDIEKKKIILNETIKSVGTTKVEMKLNEGVMASVAVMIQAK